jgi:hypothetical protein
MPLGQKDALSLIVHGSFILFRRAILRAIQRGCMSHEFERLECSAGGQMEAWQHF